MLSRAVFADDRSLIESIDAALAEAEHALLCVAFVKHWGIERFRRHLKRLGNDARLVTTTQFGSTDPAALHEATRFGTRVRVHADARTSFHPKVYFASTRHRRVAIVGSANLTSGLLFNKEIAVRLEASHDDPDMSLLVSHLESLWASNADFRFDPASTGGREILAADLQKALISAGIRAGSTIATLGPSAKPNFIESIGTEGIRVRTGRSNELETGAQLVPAWMLNYAWELLQRKGSITNTELLNGDVRVMRSSFICGLFGALDGIERTEGRSIGLRVAGTAVRSNVLAFPKPRRDPIRAVPLLELSIAAGGFGPDSALGEHSSVVPPTTIDLRPTMFVSRVTGRSMEPVVRDGEYALFEWHAGGDPDPSTPVLVSGRDIHDGETAGRFTLKYFRRISPLEVELVPANHEFDRIRIRSSDTRAYRIAARLVTPLGMERPPSTSGAD